MANLLQHCDTAITYVTKIALRFLFSFSTVWLWHTNHRKYWASCPRHLWPESTTSKALGVVIRKKKIVAFQVPTSKWISEVTTLPHSSCLAKRNVRLIMAKLFLHVIAKNWRNSSWKTKKTLSILKKKADGYFHFRPTSAYREAGNLPLEFIEDEDLCLLRIVVIKDGFC